MNIKNATQLADQVRMCFDSGKVPMISSDEPQLVYGLLNSMALAFIREGLTLKFNDKPTIQQAMVQAVKSLSPEKGEWHVIVISKKHYIGDLPEPFAKLIADKMYISVGSVMREIVVNTGEKK